MDKYIGTVLDDRYEILDAIGVGGMAYVYKAKCRRLSRNVAIKILKDEFANDVEFKRRFKNESNAVARLSHKNIVNIFDVSNSESINYIVMELIEGVTLKDYLRKRECLDWKQTLFFASQIADALDHAHSRGIIHQDIKPHNIMLLRDGTLKVADFGIAKLENDGDTKEIKEAIGSVHYVSPEQAKGNTIDIRTDLYSLGVVMYEMATGSTPYKGDTAISIVMQHINSNPAPPTLINESMPKSLEYVILKAMNPSLKVRYKTAGEVIADMEKIKENPNVVLEESSILDVLNKTQKIEKEELKMALSKAGILEENEEVPAEEIKIKEVKNEEPLKEEKVEKTTEVEDDYGPRKNAMIIMIALAVVIIITAYAVNFMLNKVFVEEIEPLYSPNVLNMLYTDIESNNLYNEYDFVVSEQIFSSEPAGTIISQKPQPYEQLALEGSVYLTVSLGEKTNIMPNLFQYEYSQAQIELAKLGISNVEIEYEYNEDIAEGKVFKTEPEYSVEITASTQVKIFISAGKEIILIRVPSLLGLSVEQAELNLGIAGLELGEVTTEISDKPEGTIIEQSVLSGTEILSESTINVVIAEAEPEPVYSTQKLTIYIPQDLDEDKMVMEIYVDNEIAFSKTFNKIITEIPQEDTSTDDKDDDDEQDDDDDVVVIPPLIVESFDEKFDATIEGTGTALVTVYANGVLIEEKIIEFN